jgi:hypothetical protein
MKSIIFRDMRPCSLVEVYRRFEEFTASRSKNKPRNKQHEQYGCCLVGLLFRPED